MQYYLGCPIWAFRGWVGSLYPAKSRADDWLAQYASVFGAVEGNGTFYALPEAATVQRWRAATPEHFRFCFKLPKRSPYFMVHCASNQHAPALARRAHELLATRAHVAPLPAWPRELERSATRQLSLFAAR